MIGRGEIRRQGAGGVMQWDYDMAGAPRDGTPILVFRDNGCGFDYYAVWWSRHDAEYPWREESGNAYPADRFDGWTSIKPPAATD